jgi:hypothetical protein
MGNLGTNSAFQIFGNDYFAGKRVIFLTPLKMDGCPINPKKACMR